jgi:hypothetical protein
MTLYRRTLSRLSIGIGAVAIGLTMAQSPLAAQIKHSIGIVGGINSYDWQGPVKNDTATYEAQISGWVGASYQARFNIRWGARVEAIFDNNKTTITATNEAVKLQYIRLQPLGELWVTISEPSNTFMVLSAGPSFGFNLSCDVGGTTCDDITFPSDIAPSLTDVSLLGAIGFAAGSFLAELRYNLGLKNLNRIASGPELETREYLIAFSYFFGLN